MVSHEKKIDHLARDKPSVWQTIINIGMRDEIGTPTLSESLW